MGCIREIIESFKQSLSEAVSIALIITSAIIFWEVLVCLTGCESPVVVVISGSMQPGIRRGDILLLRMNEDPIRVGDILVFSVFGRKENIPIVHRVIKVHEDRHTREAYFLTKGDYNKYDDIGLYAKDQDWLQRQHVLGKVIGLLPYAGWATIIMSDFPIIKYIIVALAGWAIARTRRN